MRISADLPSDLTSPSIDCGIADGLWHADNVTVHCTASDAASGLASAADASFELVTSVAPGAETANAATSTHQVCDVAGNCTTAGPVTGWMVDRKRPAILIASPILATYTIGQAVAASYSCTDGGSGISTCTGSVSSGANIDTSAVGSHTFSVKATDTVDNSAVANVTYTVVYNTCLLFDSSKASKAGSTIPIKLHLCDAAGVNVSSAAVPIVATSVFLVSTSAPAPLADSGNANPDNRFRFAGGSYIFNLSLKNFTQGTYALTFLAGNDPTLHTVQFQVK